MAGLKMPWGRARALERALPIAGLAAAFAFAVIANVLATRHYRRWDVTEARIHRLSPATLATLEGLAEPIDVWVTLGGGEALRETVKNALESYRGHSSMLRVHFVDPDKEPSRFEDVRRQFRLEPGRSAAGRALDNVAVIVARGDRHWFVERGDLVEIESAAEARVKPRTERALTAAIRAVLSGEKARVCFVEGHGEPAIDDVGPRGAGAFADVLRKDNYDPVAVDTTMPGALAALDDCAALVIATPRRPYSAEETARVREHLTKGGSALVAVSPVASKEGFIAPGLAPALAPFGIALEEALVVETDPRAFFPASRGTQLVAQVRPHGVTASLATEGEGTPAPPPVVVELARPLGRIDAPDGVSPSDLLGTSERAFGATRVTEDTSWADVPAAAPGDLPGPLSLAMASELPKPEGALRAPRVVVVGTHSVLTARGSVDPLAVGAGFFAEGAVSWLTARPPVLDIPDRPSVTAGVRLTAESMAEVKRYVLFLIPLTFAGLGIFVTWSRRRRPVS